LVGCGGTHAGVPGGAAGSSPTNTSEPTGTAGGATQGGGGQGSGSGAGGHGGFSSGGTASNAGAGSGGASPTSQGGFTAIPEECFRPYVCADTCDGEGQNFGCQPCSEGSIDTLFCPEIGATTGLFGTVKFLEGNHEPGPGPSSGTTTLVAREIRFYTTTSADSVDHAAGPSMYKAGLYSTIRASLRAKSYSGVDGKYRVTLSPGKYSVFVEDGDNWYCNLGSGEGLCVVEVPATGTLEYKIDITYAAAF